MQKFIDKNKKNSKKVIEDEEKDVEIPKIPKELLEEENKNFIVAIFEVAHRDVLIINSYERFYRTNNQKLNYVEYNEKLENEKQLENTGIYINGKNTYRFGYRCNFENPGKYTIIYKFNKPLTSAAYLFYLVDSMISIDLSNFDFRYLNITSSMFEFCSNLKKINFSNFNETNLIYTDEMFYGCKSLKLIDLPDLNLSKIKSSYNMFDGCSAKIITKDS